MKILYICTHNRCRSILSEAITNHVAGEQIVARSAGSQPVGEVHPLSIKYLLASGVNTDNLKSQSWDEFEDFSPDVVITVCDSAAQEQCPLWFGKGVKVHWGLSDPSKLVGTDAEIKAAFMATIAEIQARVEKIAGLNVDVQDKQALENALRELGAQ